MAQATIEVTGADVQSLVPKLQDFMTTLKPAEQAVLGILVSGANVSAEVTTFGVGASATLGVGVDLSDVTGGLSSLLSSVKIHATPAGGLGVGVAGLGGVAAGPGGVAAGAAVGNVSAKLGIALSL